MFELYLITEGTSPEQILRGATEALSHAPAGRIALQLRAKQLGSRQLLELGHALRALTRGRGAALLINDRVDIARLVAADGVHLPEQGVPVAAARALLGQQACVGVSCHDATGLARAAAEAANFVTLSPVFASPGKGEPLGTERFEALARTSSLPVFALGGVSPEHATALRQCGAAGLAVISAVFAAADRGAAVARFLRAWDDAVPKA